MESIGNRLRSFGLRDVVVLLTCLLGAYLLRVRDKYRLHPAWRMESDDAHLSNNQFSQNREKLPNPKITDIESDGHNEIVIATRMNLPRLKILKLPDLDNSSSKILPFIHEQSSVSLLSKDDQNLDYKQPVLIEVGFLEPYKSVVQIRKQVVVVLLADTTVLCFDYKLRLLWKKQLNTLLDYSKYYVKEAAILISSHELSPDDGGLVVVGYSLGDRHHSQQTARHSQEKPSKPLDDIFDKTPDQRMEDLVVENLDHFTVFGLAGKDGQERLHHRPGDFEALPEETDIFKAHHFKLGLRKGLAHLKEQHWSHYSQSVIQALPHRWKFGYDSAIELARFKKDAENYEGDTEAGTTLPSLFGLDDLHLAGYAFGGMRPHSPSEHVKNPNVIVTHSNEGIGVMNLVRRWPLTTLKLPHHGAVYVDFNQDGSVDEVKAHFTSDPSNSDNCLAVVHSINNPSTGVIFNASICHPPTFIDMLSVSGSFLKFHSSNFKEDVSVLPLVVKRVAKKRSVISHLRSIGLQSPNQGYDAVFLLSNGKMTSYGPHGHFNWQVDAPIQWNNQAKIFGRGRNHNPEVLDVYHNAFQPSMQAFSLQVFGKQDAAIVAGWDSIAVVSLVDGTLLADHSLPCQPTSAVVIGDFDNDGLNDAIVQCTSGYFGFQMKRQTGFWYTVALSMLLVLIVAGFTALCSFDEYYYNDDDIDKEAEE